MQQLYSGPHTCRPWYKRLSRRAWLLFILVGALAVASHTTYAQQTFFEDFNNRDYAFSLPPGWTVWQNGGGIGDPSPSWFVDRPGLGINQYVLSPQEATKEGMVDEDWLMTPQITPVAGDYLMFNARRSFFETGDMFYVRISRTDARAPESFTELLKAYTEAEMPRSVGDEYKLRIDLSAYVGVPIHIAFVHTANVGPEGESGIWLLDDVEVRPMQRVYIKDAILRQATTPPQPPVVQGREVIIGGAAELVMAGDYDEANLTAMTFSLDGTTDLSFIKEIIFYQTPYELVTNDDFINELVPRFGSIENPGQTFTITGDMNIALTGDPYMYIRFKVDEARVLAFPYPEFDINLVSYVVNGVEYTPSVSSYFGTIDIVPSSVFNDNFANAAELSPVSARYGTSTMMASYEPEYDSVVYCHNFGDRRVHSVWYYFVPPQDGIITVDLTNSRFNTIAAIVDENMKQLACSDDIADGQTRSIISDFPVTAGRKIYIRVSDLGSPWDNDNQYDGTGVVIMDFAYGRPVGTEDEKPLLQLSEPFPNPTSHTVSFDLATGRPGTVQVYLRDLLGRAVQTQEYTVGAGKRRVSLDVSHARSGMYILQADGYGTHATRKLIIAH
ncbi:T9SS-dependent choice-of-anchor J family protein [Dawidia soli]|uniref:T9SS type A sorting domain-containing protein n=1 Tax=Dawidia soli TaxID=2782352 RepID=A0AAP2D844_9BACT|nr:choice-of-anchor J domain-containing protein [Dawidia soli]MBT1686080.1 T9SS type A sorting domain-containing protein [Dawidia soli]